MNWRAGKTVEHSKSPYVKEDSDCLVIVIYPRMVMESYEFLNSLAISYRKLA